MARLLIAYSTVDGHTLKICARIQHVLQSEGHSVTLAEIGTGAMPDASHFDKLVVGASIRYGRHRDEVYEFIETRLPLLQRGPAAFFSVNLVARKPGRDDPDRNPYLRGFRRKTPWEPTVMAVFAGKLEYAKYRPADRLMIRAIMWLTGGPTDAKANVEFTDWAAVDDFARRLSSM